MDSERIVRAIVMGLTLFGVMWLLHAASARKTALEETVHVHSAPAKVKHIPDPPIEPAQRISAFPYVAMDNNCENGVEKDLSHCTGLLSGGRARLYEVDIAAGQSLRISVEPLDRDYDAAFALFKDSVCIVGRDSARIGGTEQAILPRLSPGIYHLWVGGYDGDCGPYVLSISNAKEPIGSIAQASVFTGRNGTVLRWTSFAEVGVERYQVYRVSGENRERIAVLRAHGSPAGFGTYRFMDRGPRAGTGYELEMIARDGRSEVVELSS
jgi:hypothetical protein